MEVAHNYQISFDSLATEDIDVMITYPGNDTRSTFLAEQISEKIPVKSAFCRKESKPEKETATSFSKFFNMGFSLVIIDKDDNTEINKYLENTINNLDKNVVSILIDYSKMPGYWYGAIIGYFLENDLSIEKVQLFFSYSPAKYKKSLKKKFSSFGYIGPPDTPHRTNKPTALVVGLGYEKNLAQTVFSEVKPKDVLAFYPEDYTDKRFNDKLIKNNTEILKTIRGDKIYKYPITNTERTYSILSSVCLDLRIEHNVVIAPLGPKPFGLNSQLLSAQYPDIQVLNNCDWRPVGGTEKEISGDLIINKVVFCDPEDWDKY